MEFKSKKAAQAHARKNVGKNYAEQVEFFEKGEIWSYAPKNPRAEKNGMNTQTCPECGSTELYAGRCIDGLVTDEETVIGCHHCQWELDTAPKKPVTSSLTDMLLGITPMPAEPKTEKPASNKQGIKIEKDRPQQNGVKRPSVGGACRAIWDFLDELRAKKGQAPTAAEVKAGAAENGWNPNNASIEYYHWRKFNGIAGRIGGTSKKTKRVFIAQLHESEYPDLIFVGDSEAAVIQKIKIEMQGRDDENFEQLDQCSTAEEVCKWFDEFYAFYTCIIGQHDL